MYNEKLKNEFISQYTQAESLKERCRRLFEALEPFETEWGADFCTVSEEEAARAADALGGLRTASRLSTTTILRKYSQWCTEIRVRGAHANVKNTAVNGLDTARRQYVANPYHLQTYLNAVMDPEDDLTTCSIYRCYFWLAYAGMDEEDILKVKCSDVRLDRMIVRYQGRGYPIYREAVTVFRNCRDLTQFSYRNRPAAPDDKVIMKDRAEGDELIRSFRGVPSLKAMRVEISRRTKRCVDEGKTDLHLSYFRVWLSGAFYRAREIEIAKRNLVLDEIIDHQMEGKNSNHCTNPQKGMRAEIARLTQEDYMRWKLAFNI